MRPDIEPSPTFPPKEVNSTSSENSSAPQQASQQGPVSRFFSSFRPHPNYKTKSDVAFDVEHGNAAHIESPLSRQLKNRHLQMIAFGGAVGTGLFVGAGSALQTGGPAALLISFVLIGMMLYCVTHALGELALVFPVAGSFSTYSTRFIDPAWGFAMGWNYAMQWLVTLPLEIVVATIMIDYWNSPVNKAVWVTMFWVLIVAINLFGVKGYGEAEFFFSIIKIVAVIGFIILGIVLIFGGTPGGEYVGTIYWRHPGAFASGFKGLCAVFVTAAFTCGGTELVGLAAAETANPRETLPKAIKQVFWRIMIFYIVSLTIVGLLVPYTEPRLIGGSGDASASPFVIAIENAGIKVLPSIMNVVMMVAVFSVGNSSIYASSRTLAALADNGQAPQIFSYIDRKGRPLVGIAFASSLGLLGYIATSKSQNEAFTWMLAVSGLSYIFTWGSICLAHIRFRRGWKLQGHSLDELIFQSQPGVIGSWIGLIFNCLVLVAQFWTAMWPIGQKTSAETFFGAYLAAPVVICFYIGYKIVNKTQVVRAKDMDLVTGRRYEPNLAEILAEERARKATWPIWKKFYRSVC